MKPNSEIENKGNLEQTSDSSKSNASYPDTFDELMDKFMDKCVWVDPKIVQLISDNLMELF